MLFNSLGCGSAAGYVLLYLFEVNFLIQSQTRNAITYGVFVCASSELQFGGLREGGGTREAGRTVVESLVIIYQVGTHQIRRRRRAARSLTSQGRAEPLCVRMEIANREVSEGKADL